ncbi:hypothetical protein [Paenibacillus massiliensis]|uniref:hypothetical protein n=1 Tax=Paenibacillus massiliensis TaxID=225917 RepID=UPI00036B7566|nr:hypothetical protein [Paenibacillus massiliensis]
MSLRAELDYRKGKVAVQISDIREAELIELVRRIQEFEPYGEEAVDYYLELLQRNVLMPDVSNLIYMEDLSPSEVVATALAYRPILL